MSSETDAQVETPTAAETTTAIESRAVFLELENTTVKGRQVIFDVVKSVLANKGIKLTPTLFSQHCLNPSVEHFLKILFKILKNDASVDTKLVAEITQGIQLSFADGSMKLNAQVGKLLKILMDKGFSLGAVSGLDQETAERLTEKLGLSAMGAVVMSGAAADKDFPSADQWLKLAKQVGVRPSMCIVIASSAMASKSALSAGMRCAVLPDTFTEFQDFGGADLVADSLDDESIQGILGMLDDQ